MAASLARTEVSLPPNITLLPTIPRLSKLWQTIFMISILITMICSQTTTTALAHTPSTEAPFFMPHSTLPKVCLYEMGCLQGKHMPGLGAHNFEAFLGIPYALPPVGERRFAIPKAFPRWWGILDATAPKQNCVQKNYILPNPVVEGVEDCLYLNIYRPMTDAKQLLPVMVYIHGGGWFSGSASPLLHGPEYIMETKEVILVSIAYRLGPFGFLSTDDANMPGNLGLKDQNLALRWIKLNIRAFGGDPEKVTIFGQSAGAISVHLHMLSRQSEGLFRSAITMSGTANVPFAINDSPLQQTRDIARFCNISNVEELSTAKLARALRALNAEDIINAGDKLKYWNVDPMTNFRPIAEKHGDGHAFLTQHPVKIMKEGKYTPVPWLNGGVPGEGAVRVFSILANETLRQQFNANFHELFEKLLEFPTHFTRPQLTAKTQLVIDEYFGGRPVIDNTTAQGFLDCISDRGFHHPYYNAIRAYVHTVDVKKYPVYLYKLSYKGQHSFTSIYTGGVPIGEFGAVHCDDLIYTFRSPVIFADFKQSSADASLATYFTRNLVHFAKYGKPLNVDALKPCTAATFDQKSDAICDYQEFSNSGNDSFKTSTNNKFHVKRAKLWNAILEIDD
ncbi:venom carboxylesterase-6-like [Bactrocera tryoni]|uniref:venom carboxylesterase-6-like n=1 Tax=Bactrocera tryoni TaxID=59916 RepID=UPI001A965396|nr:venom carboxylesterase-6-like [Bactrocera tryoni]